MSTINHKAAALCLALASAATAVNAQTAAPVETLWFSDSQVSAFYAVDPVEHRVIVVTEPGPQGQGRAARTIRPLAEGESFSTAIDGQDRNAITVTLTVTRHEKDMDVRVTTTARDRLVTSPSRHDPE